MVSTEIAGRFASGRVPLVVQNLRIGYVDVEPAHPAKTVTEIDVLHIHEVALVEAADRLKRRPAHQQTRSRQPTHRPFARLGALLAVGLRPGIAFPDETHHRVHPATDQAGQMPGRGIDRAVGVANQRAPGPRARPASGGRHQLIDAARPPDHIGVGDQDELLRRRHGRYGAIDRRAIPQVRAGAQQPGAWKTLDGLLRCTVGGTVVGNHHRQRPVGGHRQ